MYPEIPHGDAKLSTRRVIDDVLSVANLFMQGEDPGPFAESIETPQNSALAPSCNHRGVPGRAP